MYIKEYKVKRRQLVLGREKRQINNISNHGAGDKSGWSGILCVVFEKECAAYKIDKIKREYWVCYKFLVI